MCKNMCAIDRTANDSCCISADASFLKAGQYFNLEENHIICNKKLTLSFRIEDFSSDDLIRLGHGEEVYCASYLELTSTNFKIYEYTMGATLLAEREHGLILKDFVNITIDFEYSTTKITIASAGGVYQSGVINRCWSGRNGRIFAVSKNHDIKDVKIRWFCPDYGKRIWLFGDSYFNPISELRWTSYLIKEGYTQYLLSGYPGRNTTAALKDFKQALTHGKPEFAVWCLGMNDEDSDTAISDSYLSATSEFLSICKENNITPILSTIPCVPERNHSFKNEWVKSLKLRYINFAMAVGGEHIGSAWYDGMLYSDNVHPAALGAKALYAQFITDFPEIMKKD